MEASNPFNPGPGFEPPYLAGRDRDLEDFSHMLRNIKKGHITNMLIHGIRGVGKTVLIGRFARMCEQNGFLPVPSRQYHEGYNDPAAFAAVFKYDLRRAIETFSGPEKTGSKLRPAAHPLRPPGAGVPGTSYCEPSYESGDRIPLDSQISDYLIANWKVIERGGYEGVVFFFDEFQTIRDSGTDGTHTLADFITAVNDVQGKGYRYSVVLCGLPALQHNVRMARPHAERMFNLVRISNLTRDDAAKAMTEPLKNSGRNLSPNLVSELVNDSDGYPYFVQFYPREILERVDGTNVGLREYRGVRSEITSKLYRDFFDQRMDVLDSNHKDILLSMAAMQTVDMRFSDIAKLVGVSKGTLGRHLKRLEENGLIYRHERGIYGFSPPPFREYLLDARSRSA